MNKMEEDDNEKRKEIGLIKNQLQKVCIQYEKKGYQFQNPNKG